MVTNLVYPKLLIIYLHEENIKVFLTAVCFESGNCETPSMD